MAYADRLGALLKEGLWSIEDVRIVSYQASPLEVTKLDLTTIYVGRAISATFASSRDLVDIRADGLTKAHEDGYLR